MKRLFHYTRKSNLEKIVLDGLIKSATKWIDNKERPAVWLSYHPHFEPTAVPLWESSAGIRRLDFDEFCVKDTPARIEISQSIPLEDWRSWRKTSGVTSSTVKRLEMAAFRDRSNVQEYRVSYASITKEHWISIELFLEGEWRTEPNPT